MCERFLPTFPGYRDSLGRLYLYKDQNVFFSFSPGLYDKRDHCNLGIANHTYLETSIPQDTAYGVYKPVQEAFVRSRVYCEDSNQPTV